MVRMNSLRNLAFIAIVIGMFTTAIDARELECSYDHISNKEVRTITEIQDDSGELEYSFSHEYSKHGKELWPFEGNPTPGQTRGQQNYIKISKNLYHWGRGIFKHIIYVDFEKPKFYEVISFGPALRGLEITSRKLNDNNRMLEIPVTVWDCRRID